MDGGKDEKATQLLNATNLRFAKRILKKREQNPTVVRAERHRKRYMMTSPSGEFISILAPKEDFFHAGPAVPMYLDFLFKGITVLIL